MGIIEHSKMFFKKNWVGISLVVVGLFLILAVVAIQNIQFKEHPDQSLEKLILYEKFSGREGMSVKDRVKAIESKKKLDPPPPVGSGINSKDPKFCNRTAMDLEKACKSIKEADCKLTECCIWGKPKGNPPFCMAGSENGAKINSEKKSLEWWWYKGPEPGPEAAVKYPKSSLDFKKDIPDNIDKKEAYKSTTAVVANKKNIEEKKEAAEDTLQQAQTAKQIQENRMMQLLQQQSERALVAKHKREIERRKLEQEFQRQNVAAQTEKQTANALKILTKNEQQKQADAKLDKLKLEYKINEIAAAEVGDKSSVDDKGALAASQIKIEAEKRKLANLAKGSGIYQTPSGNKNIKEIVADKSPQLAGAIANAAAAKAKAAKAAKVFSSKVGEKGAALKNLLGLPKPEYPSSGWGI